MVLTVLDTLNKSLFRYRLCTGRPAMSERRSTNMRNQEHDRTSELTFQTRIAIRLTYRCYREGVKSVRSEQVLHL
jgi:hypothetical protein